MLQFRKIFRLAVIALVAALTISSCGLQDGGKEKSYTFKYNAKAVSGVSVDATVYEYNTGGERISQQSFKCVTGLKQVVPAESKASKVKVKVTIKAGSTSTVKWVKEVFYLQDGKNINVEIADQTLIIDKEP
jgi:uncharacterized lipoprotein YehR (DUF1307 family)